jgi:5-methylcytosine-specific restriction protein A
LRTTAEIIRRGSTATAATPETAAAEEQDEDEFPEGRIIYRLHRGRERSRPLVQRKKAQALKLRGRLACEVCDFDFTKVYGPLGAGFIECHHALPLSDLMKERKAKLEDLILVCSNCHRMIDRRRPWLFAMDVRQIVTTGARVDHGGRSHDY